MAGVLIGMSASQHDFGDYGGVGMQRPLVAAGAVPVTLAQIPEAIHHNEGVEVPASESAGEEPMTV